MNRFYCEAILFDMDGVLVNSNANVERHWRLWADHHGFDPEEILHLSHGRPTLETMRLVAPHLPVKDEAKRMHERVAIDLEGIEEVLGVKDLVTALPDGQWAVVTSADWLLAPGRLQHVGLAVPNVLITSDDVENGKPDPEGYLKAASRLGVSPEKCLVIEDAIAGVKAARAAGMQVIAITTTYSANELSEADAHISAMNEITVNQRSLENGRMGLDVILNNSLSREIPQEIHHKTNQETILERNFGTHQRTDLENKFEMIQEGSQKTIQVSTWNMSHYIRQRMFERF